MPTLKQSIELVRNMGVRYVKYRIGHMVKTRVGFYARKFPLNPQKKTYYTLDSWLKSKPAYFLQNRKAIQKVLADQNLTPVERPSCFDGKFRFFNAALIDLGKDYDWVTNPDSGFKYDTSVHWSLVNDYSAATGDIKFVWEKSRFSFIYEVIRYDAFTGEDHSAWIWQEIVSWIHANPVNAGPNYKCSQEISLRVLAWTSALYFYEGSSSLTADIFDEIQYVLYWQLKHVYDHIDFSRIAVRNNHAITESLALYIGGTVYNQFPGADAWRRNGKKWFEQEIAYQIYDDGTFLQFSMNYHRVVIQLLSLAISFSNAQGEAFDNQVYLKAYRSLEFLYSCQDEFTGYLPNYGSNDGALFFPLSSCEYRDYRPQLNGLHALLTGHELYQPGAYSEESIWWNSEKLSVKKFDALKKETGWKQFPNGGYAVLREDEGFTFIRCGSHKDRPAQADNLHIDIWKKGGNWLHDAGSYKYNTSPDLLSWFMGSKGHNTVMLGQHDQMLKGPRFIWFNWSQCEEMKLSESGDSYHFTGVIQAFGQLSGGIKHKRTVEKSKSADRWIITDEIINKPEGMEMIQLWHPLSESVLITASDEEKDLSPEPGKGWVSEYYGIKEGTNFIQFKSYKNTITTIIEL